MNIIDAIVNIVSESEWRTNGNINVLNRANSMGEALEEYVKDSFAGTFNCPSEQIRLEKLSECFSYLGNQNNPPDIILKGGDAIEVKKIQSDNSALALNSSHPKAKLYATSSLINEECRRCEEWHEKDIIYATGVVKENAIITSLSMIYGMDYAASNETYEKISNAIKGGVLSIPDIEFAETKELGRVNRVDPLGITYLRIRGMWHIENPFKVYDYIYKRDKDFKFNFMALINEEKYNEFENIEKIEWLQKEMEHFKIEDVKIKNPNNPAKLYNAKLITFKK